MGYNNDNIRMSASTAQNYNRAIQEIIMSDEDLAVTTRKAKETCLSNIINETQHALQDAGFRDPKFDLRDIQQLSDLHIDRMLNRNTYVTDIQPGDEKLLLSTLNHLSKYAKEDYGMPMTAAAVKIYNRTITEKAMSDTELAVTDRETKIEHLSDIIRTANDLVASAGHSKLTFLEVIEITDNMDCLPDQKLNELLSEDFLRNNIDQNPLNEDAAIAERKEIERVIERIQSNVLSYKFMQQEHTPYQQQMLDKVIRQNQQQDKSQDMDL